jgi:hypothetical protein
MGEGGCNGAEALSIKKVVGGARNGRGDTRSGRRDARNGERIL